MPCAIIGIITFKGFTNYNAAAILAFAALNQHAKPRFQSR